ncbi:hypothetical protein KIK84_00220 [Curvibacter sp. CHRR-16]|uniref:hypothetical protein n=1 Tax=Curvibacter sp. CHRR-16 TaxID=2835872 RepID=UPI001BDB38EA|nr:hypothetical protein [Curvibacter sp. CHRR-16]MBT0568736.1 hypothetical protein [Curvibacter sp. CHRR-16]
MQHLTVTMQLQLRVPNDWKLHTTSEGTVVVALPDGQFLDMTFEPLLATDPEDTWTSEGNEAILDELLDAVESEAVEFVLEQE